MENTHFIETLKARRLIVERLAKQAKALIPFYKLITSGFDLKIAIDWSEIFGYCFPLEDSKSEKQLEEESARARLADTLLFQFIENEVYILPPHLDEMWFKIDQLSKRIINKVLLSENEVKLLKIEISYLKSILYCQPDLRYAR